MLVQYDLYQFNLFVKINGLTTKYIQNDISFFYLYMIILIRF